MKKLSPKSLIALSSVTFLFFLLMGTVYLNDQVTFNTVNAEWELKPEYQIGVTQTSIIVTSQVAIYEYDIIFTDDPNIYHSSQPFILFTDDYLNVLTQRGSSSLVRLYWRDSESQTTISHFDLTTNLVELTPPPGSDSFRLVAHDNTDFDSIYVASEYVIYEETEVFDGYLSSYDVFENIRNNATTTNPLGFMNAIMEIPAVNIGYMRSIIEFFDVSKYKDVLGLNDTPSELMDRTDTWWFNIYERILGVGQ